MKETLGVDDEEAYSAYITYSYDGETYTDVYYKKMGSKKLYGKTVTVEIDPENPMTLRPDNMFMLLMSPIAAAVLLAMDLGLALSDCDRWGREHARKYWKEIYRSPILSQEAVRRDLDRDYAWARKCAVWTLVAFAAMALAVTVLFYINYQSLWVLMSFGMALAAVFVIFRETGAPAYQLQIRQVTLQSVGTEEDSNSVVWHFDGIDWKPNDSIFVTQKSASLSDFQPGHKFYIAQKSKTANYKEKSWIARLYDAGEFRTFS